MIGDQINHDHMKGGIERLMGDQMKHDHHIDVAFKLSGHCLERRLASYP